MISKVLVFLCVLLCTSNFLSAQAVATGEQTGDLLIGGGYVRANPDYSPHQMNGLSVYGDLDLAKHFGVVAAFHMIGTSSPTQLWETTYEAGVRSRLIFGRVEPYVKGMVGDGVFFYAGSNQNGAHLMFTGGGGLDYRLPHRIYLRADYEYQRWGAFPPRGLQPNLTSFGVAYRLR